MATVLAAITILFAIAWCITGLLYRGSAALRHAVWTGAFGAALVVAPLRWLIPHRVIAALPAEIAAPIMFSAARAGAAPAAVHFALRPATMVAGVWAFGTLALLLRLFFSVTRLSRIIRTAHGNRPILTSSVIGVPLVAGAWRPAVLLPPAAQAWTLSCRRAVIAHEAAHIRRRDPVILLAVHITTALYWFHPLCWIAAARLRAESERACDDAALRSGLQPSGYATRLLELARKFNPQLAIPMATTSYLESRVKSILDPMTNHSSVSRRAWLTVAALTIVILAPLTTLALQAQQPAGRVTPPLGPDQALFDNAIKSIHDGDYVAARGILNNLINVYDTSEYLIWAKLAIADSWFREGGERGIAQAEAEYKDFALFYPDFGDARKRVIVAAAQGTLPPAPAQPIPAGGPVQSPTLLRQVDPVYPADLRTGGTEGTVLLSAIISGEGIPGAFKVVNTPANEEFATVALAAVSQWRYAPTMVNGQPIDVPTTIQVDFKLSAR
jgi:TonB family protein